MEDVFVRLVSLIFRVYFVVLSVEHNPEVPFI